MKSYLSDKFINEAWPLCSQGLRRLETKKHYYGFVEEISNYLKCDFLDVSRGGAEKYFNALSSGEICKKNGMVFSASSIEERYRVLRSVGNTIYASRRELGLPSYSMPFIFYKTSDELAPVVVNGLPSHGDIQKLMDLCVGAYSYMRQVIALAYYCGLSVSELEGLKWGDIRLTRDGAAIVTVGVGNVFKREILVPKDVVALLKNGVKVMSEDSYLFTTRGNTGVAARDMQRGLRKIGSRWTMADLRNAAGYRFYMESGSIEDTAAFLGVTIRNIYRFLPGKR